MPVGYIDIAINNATGRKFTIPPSASPAHIGTVVVSNSGVIARLTMSAKQPVPAHSHHQQSNKSSGFEMMLASEAVLRRDWDSQEEDEAWADL